VGKQNKKIETLWGMVLESGKKKTDREVNDDTMD
jgi:hypothetical protein